MASSILRCVLILWFFACASAVPFKRSNNGDSRDETECTDGYENHPLVIVSMDGFRAEYLERGITPVLQSIIDRGVSTPYMKATYPTETYPNHYTIATGLNPESHGIVANSMYDPEFDEFFYIGSDTSFNPDWWGGDPVWNTVQRYDLKSATYFWVGSDVNISGHYPTYWYPYDGDVTYEERIDQTLEWLAMNETDRPSFIALYFDEPDHSAHDYGPEDPFIDGVLAKMDNYIGMLVDGIENMGLTDCVNLFIVADHGMTEAGYDKIIYLGQYIPEIDTQTRFFDGAFARMDIYEEYMDLKEEMMVNISCQDESLRQFDKTELPKRLHYTNNRRIDDIILDLDLGYFAQDFNNFTLIGLHGYDYIYEDMQPIFLGAGPDLKEGFSAEPFANIELYNLLCDLLSVPPSPNNGTIGALYHLMKNPPEYPEQETEAHPDVPEFPDETEIVSRLNISECDGDLTEPEDWLHSLNFTTEEQMDLEALHLPWGMPHTGDLPADIIILHQEDHVTGYSEYLKLPLWTSFTLKRQFSRLPGTKPAQWSSDVRLDENNTPTCTSYEDLLSLNITQSPLFRPGFSSNEDMDRVPYLISNSVPMSLEFEERWSELQDELIPSWAISGISDLNVITGPVFDLNSDSFVDNFTEFSSTPQPASDFFAILSRCNKHTNELKNCDIDDTDTLAFIYHDGQIASNCLARDFYAQLFIAKVNDIEKATGLTFFTDLSYKDATRLRIRVQSDIWDHCVPEQANDILPNFFDKITRKLTSFRTQ